MKLKKIESICKRSKTIVIINDNGIQWIGEYGAFYLIEDMPELASESIFAIFDVQAEQREKWLYNEQAKPKTLILSDHCVTDNEISVLSDYGLIKDGTTLIPVITSQGLKFINKAYLKPFDKEQITVYERLDSVGKLYFVIKKGLFIKALILPSVFTDNGADLKEWSRKFAELMKTYVNDMGFVTDIITEEQTGFDKILKESENKK